MSSIALRQYTFGVGPFTFAHNFLVLYDNQGNVVAELHGKPADPAIDAMGLQLPSMPTMAPGAENQLLPQNQIDQIRQNNGIPPAPKGGLF
jgi:hypothetical protein